MRAILIESKLSTLTILIHYIIQPQMNTYASSSLASPYRPSRTTTRSAAKQIKMFGLNCITSHKLVDKTEFDNAMINEQSDNSERKITYIKSIQYLGTTYTQEFSPHLHKSLKVDDQAISPSRIILTDCNSFTYDMETNLIFNLMDASYKQSSWKILQKKTQTCRCRKSKCQKRYCQCYSNNQCCNPSCGCLQCLNSKQQIRPIRKKQKLKCTCSNNNCAKDYCICKKSNKVCGADCNCLNCSNQKVVR